VFSLNWEAIAAIGEIVGALAVVLTLAYLASQVKTARRATIDQNTLTRATGVREKILQIVENDELRINLIDDYELRPFYEQLAKSRGISVEEASRVDWSNSYWFWLHWGQWASTHDKQGLEELKHLLASFYSNPGMRRCWESSPWGKPLFDPEFVRFVDDVLEGHDRENT
jgi:hypothetical protein